MHFELGELADLQRRLQQLTNILQMSQCICGTLVPLAAVEDLLLSKPVVKAEVLT